MKWPRRLLQCRHYPTSQGTVPFSFLERPPNSRRCKSSTAAWLSRQRSDHFLKIRSEANYRSRSAFKLVQINEQYKLFPPLSHRSTREKRPFTVVDLGCAPGGWTQASLELLGFSRNAYNEENDEEDEEGIPQVVGVDLIQTEPLLGARFLQGNFLDEATQRELRNVIQGVNHPVTEENSGEVGVADLIISDMAPNLSGNKIADIEASLELCRSVLSFAQRNLRRAEEKAKGKGYIGSLVIKHFVAPEFNQFREQELAPHFSQKIKYTKPEASRSSSSEAYFVCQGFKGWPGPAWEGRDSLEYRQSVI